MGDGFYWGWKKEREKKKRVGVVGSGVALSLSLFFFFSFFLGRAGVVWRGGGGVFRVISFFSSGKRKRLEGWSSAGKGGCDRGRRKEQEEQKKK